MGIQLATNGTPNASNMANTRESESRMVKRLREALHMNQTDFGKRVGVTPRTIQLWEAGKHTPKGKAKVRLAQMAQRPQIAAAPATKFPTRDHASKETPAPHFRRWNVTTGQKEDNTDVDAFLNDIVAVCQQHGFIIVPEDDSIAAEVRPFDDFTAGLLLRSQTKL